ncbi:MAG: SBBP repeat-containing protein [Bacteroidia bacterium]
MPKIFTSYFLSFITLSLLLVLQNGNALAEHNISIDNNKFKNGNVGFVKNAGQVYDYDKRHANTVLYSLNADNSSIFLTTSGLTYSIIEREFQNASPASDQNRVSPDKNCTDKKVVRLDMNMLGAVILKQNIVEMEYINDVPLCFYGTSISEEAQQLRFCRQVLIKNIYPDIDWLLKITPENTFKYDFIIHPGGDLSRIRFQYNGSSSITLNKNKDQLTLATPLGNITEGKLYCYTQEDQFPILSKYIVGENIVGVNIAGYNKNKTLVVDPAIEMVLTWSTYYGGGAIGGGGGTVCNGIKCDEAHNRVYVTGYCFSNPFPVYNNSVSYYFYPSLAGSSIEAFISAFDLSGAQQWATYYMSTDYDAAFDVTTDNNGNVYMVGTTESHNSSTIGFLTQALPGSANSYLQSTNHATPMVAGVYNYQEGFIVRFNSSGKLKWATLLGGDRTDQLYSVACDNNNNVFVAGLTWSQSLLPLLKQGSAGFIQPTLNGGQDGLIASFNSNTKLMWCTYYGNSGTDCRTIKCDGSNNIYVTGAIGSATGFPFYAMAGAYNNKTNGYYVSVFYPGTKRKWCSSFQSGQCITDLCISKSDGTVLVTGYTIPTTTFPWQKDTNATPNSFFDDTYNGGEYDGFLMTLDPDYSLRWATMIGGVSNDMVTAAAISNTGKIFITGYTDNSYINTPGNLPVVNPGAPSYFEGNMAAYTPAEIFISAFDSKSAADPYQLVWSTLFGDDNSGREIAYDMDMSGNSLYMSGNAFLEPANPTFPLIHEQNGFLQCAANPMVAGFNPSGSNGLILKFANYEGNPLKDAPDNVTTKSSLKIYPNPCSEPYLNLQTGDYDFTNAQFKIVDVYGRTIKNLTLKTSQGEVVKIDLEGVSKGYYFLSVSNGDDSEQIPFIRF